MTYTKSAQYSVSIYPYGRGCSSPLSGRQRGTAEFKSIEHFIRDMFLSLDSHARDVCGHECGNNASVGTKGILHSRFRGFV
jgi:hypothetical protein